MITLQVALPDWSVSVLRRGPQDLACELRVAAAIHWYERGKLSLERAAEAAGMDRAVFLAEMEKRESDVSAEGADDLRKGLCD